MLGAKFFRQKSPKLFRDWINEYSLIQSQKIRILHFSANFWWIFFRISRQIPENSDVCRFFNQICENKTEICRKFWILWKKIHYYSELFTSLLRSDASDLHDEEAAVEEGVYGRPHFSKILQIVKIIHYYSELFTSLLRGTPRRYR